MNGLIAYNALKCNIVKVSKSVYLLFGQLILSGEQQHLADNWTYQFILYF